MNSACHIVASLLLFASLSPALAGSHEDVLKKLQSTSTAQSTLEAKPDGPKNQTKYEIGITTLEINSITFTRKTGVLRRAYSLTNNNENGAAFCI